MTTSHGVSQPHSPLLLLELLLLPRLALHLLHLDRVALPSSHVEFVVPHAQGQDALVDPERGRG